jgi:hypothetical protein
MAGNRFGPLSEWGRQFARRGITTLVIGTRGSDWAWSYGGGLYGGSYERLDEAPLDVTGAVGALRRLGHNQVLLAGQSLGAVKIVFAQATAPIEGVVGVIPRSGPRFSADALAAGTSSPGPAKTSRPPARSSSRIGGSALARAA